MGQFSLAGADFKQAIDKSARDDLTARSEASLAAIAYHDLGVLALERGDLASAREAFFDALVLVPDDRRTRFNLEWTLRALAEQPPATIPPRPPPGRDEPRSDRDPHSEDPSDTTGSDATGHQDLPRDPGQREEPAVGETDTHARPADATSDGDARREATERLVTGAPTLDAKQRQAWLQRIQDDPARALRSAAMDEPRGRPLSGPGW